MQTERNETIPNRKVYLDMIRVIATFLVLFNHLPGYSNYYTSKGIEQFVSLFLAILTRVNVPLFFMVSGCLLLGREESIRIVFSKRVSRIIIVLIVFELINWVEGAVIISVKQGSLIQLDLLETTRNLILSILAGTVNGSGSYWYLYSYLGMLLLLPFLRDIAKKLEVNKFLLLISLHALIWTILPILNCVGSCHHESWKISIDSHFSICLATEKAFFYPLIGYYIDQSKTVLKNITFLTIVAICGVVIEYICTYAEYAFTGEMSQNYLQLCDYFIAILTYVFIKKMFVLYPQLSVHFRHFLCTVGGVTLGVYLMDQFYKTIFYSLFNNYFDGMPYTLSLTWCLFSFLIGGITTAILKRLPLFRVIL